MFTNCRVSNSVPSCSGATLEVSLAKQIVCVHRFKVALNKSASQMTEIYKWSISWYGFLCVWTVDWVVINHSNSSAEITTIPADSSISSSDLNDFRKRCHHCGQDDAEPNQTNITRVLFCSCETFCWQSVLPGPAIKQNSRDVGEWHQGTGRGEEKSLRYWKPFVCDLLQNSIHMIAKWHWG